MHCPNCDNKMDHAIDIDHNFYGDQEKWFCTIHSYFCSKCEYIILKADSSTDQIDLEPE